MKVLLNCFPPSDAIMPDLGLSVLKRHLNLCGITCNILYWNILLFKYTKDIIPVNPSNDIVGTFLPYLLDYNNGELDRLKFYLQYKNPSWNVVDNNFYEKYLIKSFANINRVLARTIRKKKIPIDYDLIGISYKFSQWIPGLIFVKKLKEINPALKIVVGGIPSRIEAVKFLETFADEIDFTIWGEGEIALQKLCEFLKENEGNEKLPDNIQSLAYKKDQSIVVNNGITEYATMVVPDYSDFIIQSKSLRKHIILNMEVGRGCYWNRCKFCYLNEGYKYRRKPINQVLSDIDYIVREYKVKKIFFNDNDLGGANKVEFEALLDALIEFNKTRGISFVVAEFNSRKLSKQLIKKASQAGFKMFQIGIESISDKKLKKIDKHARFIDHLLAIKFCIKYGIVVTGANLIKGFQDDSEQDVIESVGNLHFLRFYFGSQFMLRLIDLCIKQTSQYYNQIPPEDLKKYHSDLAFLINNEKILANKFYFFEHVNIEYQPMWAYFDYIMKYYATNKFKYQYSKSTDEKTYCYTEFVNNNKIVELQLSNQDWAILEGCNNSITSIEELEKHLKGKQISLSKSKIEAIVADLVKEKIIYQNEHGELFSVIDTDSCL